MSTSSRPPGGPTLKTYLHLAGRRRLPSEYELVTSNLLYYTRDGMEVDVPIKGFYARNQSGSPLGGVDFERFVDPRQTTSASYTALQNQRELFVDGILQSIEDQGYDGRLGEAWLSTLERVLSPARYLTHGLQMLAAYVGSMAPGGRITLVAMFQAADEVRRTQRFAYRMRQLQSVRSGFGENGKRVWQEDAAWQPVRRAVEELLVTYDWGRALTLLNLGLKPLCDELLLRRFAVHAAARGDVLLNEIWRSLFEDSVWQRSWSVALFRLLFAERPENRQVVTGWLAGVQAQYVEAVAALGGIWSEVEGEAEALWGFHRSFLAQLGVEQGEERQGP